MPHTSSEQVERDMLVQPARDFHRAPDDDDRVIAFTDGSALNAVHRITARAGWGVWYALESPHNVAKKLAGPI